MIFDVDPLGICQLFSSDRIIKQRKLSQGILTKMGVEPATYRALRSSLEVFALQTGHSKFDKCYKYIWQPDNVASFELDDLAA